MLLQNQILLWFNIFAIILIFLKGASNTVSPSPQILSEIDVLGSKFGDDNRSSRHPEVKTLDTIRDIEKGLQENLQEYMNFLQVLMKDNSRRGATAEWVHKDVADRCQELEVIHATRPRTAPPIHEHLQLAQRISYEFDQSTVASDSSCENGEVKNPRFQTVVSEVDLEWNPVKPKTAPPKGYLHHDCCGKKNEPRNILQGLNGRIKTWSTESISESHTPKSVLSSAPTHKAQIDKVSVCVRMRPFNEHEKVCPLKQVLCSQKDKVIVKDYNYLRQGTMKTKAETLQFDVDYVLDDSFLPRGDRQRKEESQKRMFETLGLPCIEYALDGYNTTIMAYGQMGSGKTYTMMGDGTLCGRGLVPRIAHELMHRAHEDRMSGIVFSIQVSYLEIYQGKVRDLLVDKKLDHTRDYNNEEYPVSIQVESPSTDGMGSSFSFQGPVKKDYFQVREQPVTGSYVEDLIWKDVTTSGEMETLVKQGAANRTFGTTNTHRLSSRGPTLFTIKLIRMHMNDKAMGTSVSHINLVDLAGSEKMAMCQKPLAERTYESKYINRSLAQLNEVFTSLSSGRSNGKFVSYRSSSLIWLLRESLCGSSKTFLVANFSPAEQDFQESVHTLRCAAKAKRIHGPSNQDPVVKKQMLMKMNEEIRTLQYLIAGLTRKTTLQTSTEIIRKVTKPPNRAEEQLFPCNHVDGMRSSQLQSNGAQQRRPSSQPQGPKSGGRSLNAKERLQNANKRFLVTFKENSSVFIH